MPVPGREAAGAQLLPLATSFFFLQVLLGLRPQLGRLSWLVLCPTLGSGGALQALPWVQLCPPFPSSSVSVFDPHGHNYSGCQWLPRPQSLVQNNLPTSRSVFPSTSGTLPLDGPPHQLIEEGVSPQPLQNHSSYAQGVTPASTPLPNITKGIEIKNKLTVTGGEVGGDN